MDATGVAALITALVGALSLGVGGINILASRKDTKRAEAAKDELEHERLELEQRRYNDEVSTKLLTAASDQAQRERERADREREWGEKHYKRAEAAEERIEQLRDALHSALTVIREEALRIAVLDGVSESDRDILPQTDSAL